MAIRQIVHIDEELCNGCPTGALTIEEREAPAFDEERAEALMHERGRVYITQRCFRCETGEDQTPLVPIRYQGQSLWDGGEQGRTINLIAPSHGPMYDWPPFILDAYRAWVSEKPRNVVVLPYISMHGSTREMVEYLVGALAERGLTVYQFDLAVTDIGKLAITLVDAATLVIGAPTVNVGPYPVVAYAAYLANALWPKLKFASIIGSCGWNSKVVERIAALIPDLKIELLEPVLCKGRLGEAEFTALDRLADSIAARHKEQGFD